MSRCGASLRRASLVVLLAAASSAVFAQSSVPAPLPAAAQEALDKGVLAARVPDYLLAIRYFEEARKAAPQEPVIYFNLGLAESRVPGRELRAMAWFGAYLASTPGAPNAAAVKEQVALLEARNRSNLSRVIKSVEEAAGQGLPGDRTDSHLYKAAALWIESGDIASALKLISRFRDAEPMSTFSYKQNTIRNIAMAQAERRDFAGALNTYAMIRSSDAKSRTLQVIASEQAKAGDVAGARKTAERIEPVFGRSHAQRLILVAQLQAGDIAAAQKAADAIEEAVWRSVAKSAVAEAQAAAGDLAAAERTLAEAQKVADGITNSWKEEAQKAAAAARAKLAAAKGPGERVPAPSGRQTATPDGASEWLKLLDDSNRNNDGALASEPFLDLAAYMKLLSDHLRSRGEFNNPERLFKALHDTAQRLLKAQNLVHAMAKAQAAPR